MSDEEKEIGDAVQLILNRMDSNPEEFLFASDADRWRTIMDRYWEWMTQQERASIEEKMKKVQREYKRTKLHEAVMEKLLAENEQTPLNVKTTL